MLTGLSNLALPGSAPATLTITEVDLANDKAEFVNLTTNTVDASSWWLCNRVNGSPFYPTLASATIDTNLSSATSLVVAPGEILVLEIVGLLPDANGELGTYNVNNFGSASAIEDYIAWGAGGIRDSGQAGDSKLDYFIDMSTLGEFGPPVSTDPPLMSIIASSPGLVQISWTPDTPGFVLQEAPSLSPTNWVNSPSDTNNPALIPVTGPAKFYRLRNP
jgi:hypothetical protein